MRSRSLPELEYRCRGWTCASLDPDTTKRAAEGIVAYSDFCTACGLFFIDERHRPEEKVIFCHSSQLEVRPDRQRQGRGWPAKQPLAGLPVNIADGKVVVAGEFEGKVGAPKPT